MYVTNISRRNFLGSIGIVSAAGIFGISRFGAKTGQRVIDLSGNPISIPDADPTVNGQLAPYITPEESFFRIDTAIGAIPEIDANTWTLRIHGMVDKELTLSLADIAALPQVEHIITLGCVSNEVGGDLIGNASWGGVLLADILQHAGVNKSAEQLVSTSVDGWTCGTPVSAVLDGRPAMLVTSMNGKPLSPVHGYPVRMIVPGLFGYVSATKWISDIEITTWDAFDAYWVRRGWSAEGPMLSSSRIDLPRPDSVVATGTVNVGGFAWAPRAGIQTVQLMVNDAAWVDCEVLAHDSGDTWAQWKYPLPVTPGDYSLTVRVIDKLGNEQTSEKRDVAPSGATGHHSISFSAA